MNVVITGSTKGIGLGLAREFLARSHNVTISSRRAAAVSDAVDELSAAYPEQVGGLACDVADIAGVRALWQAARDKFGQVDIWINNAGITNVKEPLHEVPDEQITQVVNTNLIGTLNCCKVVIAGMREQGSGKLFNMEGFGSDGMTQDGLSVYGATKYAVRYLTKALIKENKDAPVIIGYMSPGIVVTDLLTKDLYETRKAEIEKPSRFLTALADRVETVTPFLAEGAIRAEKNGCAVRWMSGSQATGRLLKSLFVKRDPFAGAQG